MTVTVEGARWRVRPEAGVVQAPGPCSLLLRPEGLAFTTDSARGVPATVTDRRYAGASTFYVAQTAAGVALELAAPSAAAVVGQAVRVAPAMEPAGPDDGVHLFPAAPA